MTPQKLRMPALFVGHGDPMNALRDNAFTKTWTELGRSLPRPEAILVISAHWLTDGSLVTAMEKPPTIHDFYGFPPELYFEVYPAPGSPATAAMIQSLPGTQIGLDQDWGLDHGAWTVLKFLFPAADIPVLQLSIDYHRPASWHYDFGRKLLPLREKGLLIAGSGNIVHNLPMIQFGSPGAPWCVSADRKLKELIRNSDHEALISYEKLGDDIRMAVPSPDHYYPLLYVLGLQTSDDNIVFFNEQTEHSSLSMTSLLLQPLAGDDRSLPK